MLIRKGIPLSIRREVIPLEARSFPSLLCLPHKVVAFRHGLCAQGLAGSSNKIQVSTSLSMHPALVECVFPNAHLAGVYLELLQRTDNDQWIEQIELVNWLPLWHIV